MNTVMPYSLSPAAQDGSLDGSQSRSVRQQSIEASVSQSVNLTLMTREGDKVTLSSNAVADLQAMTYDRTGKLQGPDTQGAYSMNYRSMTLSSGSQFTFSVSGNLSPEELDDIGSILGSLDEIMGQMTGGNMDKALAAAMAMDGYATVSRFEADLNLSSSVSAETRTQTQARGIGAGAVMADSASPLEPAGPGAADRMKSLFENRDSSFLKVLASPVNQLFSNQLTPLEAANEGASKMFSDLIESLKSLHQEIMGALGQA
ncbi:MAG: hypothetical protein V1793_05475 [Pseudomonadota bacterium]